MSFNLLKHSIKMQLLYVLIFLDKVYISLRYIVTFKPKSWDTITHNVVNRNRIYRYYQVSFLKFCPAWIIHHRKYFKDKGFGEDAFHAFWFDIISTFKPKRLLEIGVYRGQVISLWALIGKKLDFEMEVVGISPLNNSADTVSSYISMDYESDVYSHFLHFSLDLPTIKKGLSKEHTDYIRTGDWDLIYIDGSHNYEDVSLDLESAYVGLKKGGLVILDDSSLFTSFKPIVTRAFKGHPGPSRIFSEIDINKWTFLCGVGHNNLLCKK